MAGMTKWRQMAGLILLAACAASPCEAAAANPAPLTGPQNMLHAQGTKWVRADGTQVNLKGANLGNWLINEFWMMGQGSHGIDDQCKLEEVLDHRFGYEERQRLFRLYRDNWITTKDWDMLASFGLNVVRIPFIHTVVEDEKNPGHLRADAWHYLDDAIAQAEKRGMYVILDLHGAAGSQGWEHHSGCAGLNQFWSTPADQQRTIWLWQQIAARYKDRASVAGYSLLNEPWGTPPEHMADVITTLYKAVRAVDQNHIIILPGHHTGIGAYGDPAQRGMVNVAFEMHPYPGHFGWGVPGPAVHRGWLLCTDPKSDTVCAWDQRMKALNTPLYFGEVQPWAKMGLETGGQVARASFDTYARHGWAVTAWSYKFVSNEGGHGQGTWGMVTNAAGERVPDLDFNTASLAQIESLFKRFGTMRYEPHGPLKRWLTSPTPPDPFGLTRPHEESK